MNKEERIRAAMVRKMQRDLKTRYYYILKGGYYYRSRSRGYTPNRIEAGIYTKEEAISHVSTTSYVVAVAVDEGYHNKNILEEIKRLTNYIIY